MLFFRKTTKCIAVLNSSRDRAPSLVMSASCLQRNIHSLFQLLHNYCQCDCIITVISNHITRKCYMSKLYNMTGFLHLNLRQLNMYQCFNLSCFTYHFTWQNRLNHNFKFKNWVLKLHCMFTHTKYNAALKIIIQWRVIQYHIFRSSWTGKRDFSKNCRAAGPAISPVGSGWSDLNWAL
jgi:hypothetical protein